MSTVVGVKDFRNNISAFIKQVQECNISLLITSKSKAVVEIRPYANKMVDSSMAQEMRHYYQSNIIDTDWDNFEIDNLPQ